MGIYEKILAANTSPLLYSFFLSLTFWGLASLSIVYAKGYAALLVLRSVVLFSDQEQVGNHNLRLDQSTARNWRGGLLCWSDILLVILV